MKVIFIGNPIESHKYLEVTKDYLFSSFADNKAELTIIKGLHEKYQKDFNLITINVDNKNKTEKIQFGNNINTIGLKYNNKNSFIYYLNLMFEIKKQLKKICKMYKNEKIVVISNGPYLYYSYSVIRLKRKYKINYVPFLIGSVELPEYKGIYKFVASLTKLTIKLADGTITFVEASSKDYTNKPYVLLLHTLDNNQITKANGIKLNKKNNNKINILFTGALTEINGIEMLLQVIEKLPDNFFLTICGDGELKENVIEFEKRYPQKLKYLGFIAHDEVMKLQKNSDLLIFIRNTSNKIFNYYIKYAAPSKVIEYLLSGKPIVINNILSLSNEIKPYLNILKESAPDKIANEIIELFKNPKLLEKKAQDGQKFIIEKANEDVQNKKAIDFLENNFNKKETRN